MRRMKRRSLAAATALTTGMGLVALLSTPAYASTRVQAENGSFGPACGDGSQPETTNSEATGETTLFMNGDGCYVSFTAGGASTIERVRWYGGGTNGSICGTFGLEANGSEVARTASQCSTGGAVPTDFQLATFPAGANVAAGTYRIVWHPNTSWHDAHVDWIEYSPLSTDTRYETENGTFGPPCGDGAQPESTNSEATGETTLFMNGDGCYVTWNSSSSHTPKRVRWYGGGQNGSICGHFSIVQGSTEVTTTGQSCSVGGSSPNDFQVATFNTATVPSGNFSLVWHPNTSWHDAHVDWFETTSGGTPPPPNAPPNDNFASAAQVSILPSTYTVTTNGATRETGEPQQCGTTTIDRTAWYRLPSPNNQPIRVNTAGSDFNTVVGVYTGSSVAALVPVGCNDDVPGSSQADLVFAAQAGTTYWIQVGGAFGAGGNVSLRVSVPSGPTNDFFSAATSIGSLPYSASSQSNTGATQETGEPTCGYNATKTVWYRYTHPSSSTVRRVFANTFGSSMDTTLAVYTGSPVNALTQKACNDDAARGGTVSEVSWDAQPGVTYSIQVAGYNLREGSFSLQVVEGTLVTLGDSVVAGHGVGQNPTGYPNNPTFAYPQLMADDKHMRIANMARTGACASGPTVFGADSNTPSACATSIMGDQINSVPFTPTHVVIGVGADDIEFAKCMTGFVTNSADKGVCQGTSLTTHINSLKANLGTVLQTVKTKWTTATSPAPFITVVGYYNPFPPAPPTTSPSQVCDMWMPALDKRDQDYAGRDHHTTDYQLHVIPVQDEAYHYAVDVLNELNTALSTKAAEYGATYVSTLATFDGHDMCANIRGASVPSVFVFGPEFTITYSNPLTGNNQSYTSRPMATHCNWPQSQHGDGPTVYDYFWYHITFYPNCLPHPTITGQMALAGAVEPSLPLP